MRITVNPEAIDLMEANILDDFSEVKIHMVETNILKTHTKVNIKVTIIKVITTKALMVYTTIMANLEAEAVVVAEVITTDVVTAGLIIEAITTINTISIMVMMMIISLINMVHHVHCGGYNHSPKHCFKGEHDINDIMEKMNISGHQSQQSGLYS